jgi:hypothetical protein
MNRRRKLHAQWEPKTESSIGSGVLGNREIEPARAVQGQGSEESAFLLPNILDINKPNLGAGASLWGSVNPNNGHNHTWGEKSPWSFQCHGERQHAETKDDESGVESLALWIVSSNRTTYSVWGSAGDTQPVPQQPSIEVNNSSLNLITQSSLMKNGQFAQGSGHEDGSGCSALNNSTKWTSGNNKVLGVPKDQPHIPGLHMGLQNASKGKTMVQPNGRHRGLGRGTDMTKPSWMTHGKVNSGKDPVQEVNNYPQQLQSHGNTRFGMASVDYNSSQMNSKNIPTPAFSTSPPNAVQGQGRGRGRAMTMPAWVTKQQQYERP